MVLRQWRIALNVEAGCLGDSRLGSGDPVESVVGGALAESLKIFVFKEVAVFWEKGDRVYTHKLFHLLDDFFVLGWCSAFVGVMDNAVTEGPLAMCDANEVVDKACSPVTCTDER